MADRLQPRCAGECVMVTLTGPAKLVNMGGFLRDAPVGLAVEVGVFEGGSLEWLASRFPDRQFVGFDTFEGLPESGERDNFHRKGHFASSFEEVSKRFAKLPNVKLVRGVFPGSAGGLCGPIALAHVDVDLFEHTLASLRHLAPLMTTGGRIYCDDVYVPTCEGATAAAREFSVEIERPIGIEWPEHAFFQF